MLNGAAVSFTSKMQTLTAPSTTWAETKTLFDCSTDVLGLRNLLSELGHLQEAATVIYQDNKSAIQIATNRGSLGKTSRAMDLQTLSIRNRIEDHQVFPIYTHTTTMLADMGSKALPEMPFIKFRDVMNGYALVKAHHPDKALPDYVYNVSKDPSLFTPESISDSHHPISRISALILGMKCTYLSHDDDEDLPDEAEEEEEDNDDHDMESTHEDVTSDEDQNDHNAAESHQDDNDLNEEDGNEITDNQSSDDEAIIPIPCYAFQQNGVCKWESTCRFLHQGHHDSDEEARRQTNVHQSSAVNDNDAVTMMPCQASNANGFCKWGAHCRFQPKRQKADITTPRCFDQNDQETLNKFITFTHDLVPQEKLGGCTPYEMRTGNKPGTITITTGITSMPIERMRGGSDELESDNDNDNMENNSHDDESSLEEDVEYNINHSTNPCPAYSPIHDLINHHISSDVNNGGVSSSPYSFNMNHYPGLLWENDDLPDPRLYNIDIGLMRHWHIRDRVDTTRLTQMTYHSYHRYLQEIEPGYYGASVSEATNKFTISTVNQHLPTADSVSRNMPSPVMFCPPVLDSDPLIRSRQIQRALNKFIIRLESLIENKSIDEVTDNIYWGLFIPNPIPKRSWLRWIRWRTYYNHLTFSNTIDGTNTTELECPEYGPAFLRPIDKRRMSRHNCFSLDTHTAQFYHLGGCCKENSRLPKVRHVDQDKVIIYINASIWRLGQDDYIDSTYLVHKPEAFRGAITWRQKRLNTYFKQLNPEWGRWAKEVKEINPYQSASKRLKTKE